MPISVCASSTGELCTNGFHDGIERIRKRFECCVHAISSLERRLCCGCSLRECQSAKRGGRSFQRVSRPLRHRRITHRKRHLNGGDSRRLLTREFAQQGYVPLPLTPCSFQSQLRVNSSNLDLVGVRIHRATPPELRPRGARSSGEGR